MLKYPPSLITIMAMKGLILAGGLGRRIRPLTHAGPKQLIPVANKPVMHYAIEDLVASGIRDIGIIVGYTPERISAIKESCGSGEKWNARITYIEQDAPLGLAHAVWTARNYLGSDNFVMYLGDNLIGSGIKKFVEEFVSSGADASLLLAKSRSPERFGVAELAGGRVISVEEKPATPRSDTVLAGVYIFSPAIMKYIKNLKPSARGELEITHAIQRMIQDGRKIIHHVIQDWWDDAGTAEDILHANRMILSKMEGKIEGSVVANAIAGAVRLGKGSVVKGSTIAGPAIIGENVLIEDARIGPYTSIGNDVKIAGGSIESSIIMDGCTLRLPKKKLVNSLIGKSCVIKESDAMSFVIGEDSRVEI